VTIKVELGTLKVLVERLMDQEWDLSIRMMEKYSLGPLGDIALTPLASM
jgi:hypothetical protein